MSARFAAPTRNPCPRPRRLNAYAIRSARQWSAKPARVRASGRKTDGKRGPGMTRILVPDVSRSRAAGDTHGPPSRGEVARLGSASVGSPIARTSALRGSETPDQHCPLCLSRAAGYRTRTGRQSPDGHGERRRTATANVANRKLAPAPAECWLVANPVARGDGGAKRKAIADIACRRQLGALARAAEAGLVGRAYTDLRDVIATPVQIRERGSPARRVSARSLHLRAWGAEQLGLARSAHALPPRS